MGSQWRGRVQAAQRRRRLPLPQTRGIHQGHNAPPTCASHVWGGAGTLTTGCSSLRAAATGGMQFAVEKGQAHPPRPKQGATFNEAAT